MILVEEKVKLSLEEIDRDERILNQVIRLESLTNDNLDRASLSFFQLSLESAARQLSLEAEDIEMGLSTPKHVHKKKVNVVKKIFSVIARIFGRVIELFSAILRTLRFWGQDSKLKLLWRKKQLAGLDREFHKKDTLSKRYRDATLYRLLAIDGKVDKGNIPNNIEKFINGIDATNKYLSSLRHGASSINVDRLFNKMEDTLIPKLPSKSNDGLSYSKGSNDDLPENFKEDTLSVEVSEKLITGLQLVYSRVKVDQPGNTSNEYTVLGVKEEKILSKKGMGVDAPVFEVMSDEEITKIYKLGFKLIKAKKNLTRTGQSTIRTCRKQIREIERYEIPNSYEGVYAFYDLIKVVYKQLLNVYPKLVSHLNMVYKIIMKIISNNVKIITVSKATDKVKSASAKVID